MSLRTARTVPDSHGVAQTRTVHGGESTGGCPARAVRRAAGRGCSASNSIATASHSAPAGCRELRVDCHSTIRVDGPVGRVVEARTCRDVGPESTQRAKTEAKRPAAPESFNVTQRPDVGLDP